MVERMPDRPADTGVPATPPSAHADRPWLAHYAAGVPATIPVRDRTVPDMLDDATQQFGAREVILFYGVRLSFAELAQEVSRFAHALAGLGVRRGDRIALCLPNVPQFPIAFYGALKAGAIVVPTNPLYTEPELRHQLTDAGVTVVVTLEQSYPTLAAVRAETPVQHVILGSVVEYLPRARALGYHIRQAGESRRQSHVDWHLVDQDSSVHRFKDLLGQERSRPHTEAPVLTGPASPDDIAVLQYTGGTTGTPKGAMLTHRNLVANATQAWVWCELDAGPHRTLCVAPFFHVYGLTAGLNGSLFNGCTLVLLPRFTPKEVIAAIERYQPDVFPGIPAMYQAIARAMERQHANLTSIRVCVSGAAPLPGEVQARFEQISGARLVEGYGLTEASPITHANPVSGERRPGAIGLPVSSTEAGIVGLDDWRFLPPGENGEIVVKGPQVMQGYWNRPDETAKVLRDGWLRTGDIGTMDAEGYFNVMDRAKDMIVVSGFNVYPREVEEVLYQHPKVLEVCVVGVPDGQRVEVVHAYVVPEPDERPTTEELRRFCQEHLAPYKVPKQIEFCESLPTTLTGKVLRRAVREEATGSKAAVPSPGESA
jgi:long-chain acyl-CoA synthetase